MHVERGFKNTYLGLKISSMDRGFVEVSIKKKKEGLDRKEYVEDLSRSCRA